MAFASAVIDMITCPARCSLAVAGATALNSRAVRDFRRCACITMRATVCIVVQLASGAIDVITVLTGRHNALVVAAPVSRGIRDAAALRHILRRARHACIVVDDDIAWRAFVNEARAKPTVTTGVMSSIIGIAVARHGRI